SRARAHRRRAGREPRPDGRSAQCPERAGRADRRGRLRDGLFELELSLAAADRLPQDRPLVRKQGPRTRARRGDHASGDLARTFAGGAGDRGRSRDRGAAGIPAHAPLRSGPGVSVFPRRPSRGDGAAPGRRLDPAARREIQLKAQPGRRENTMEKMILLVEDNPNDEELTLRALRKANIANSVFVARDGQEAVDFLFGTGKHAGREAPTMPAVVLL